MPKKKKESFVRDAAQFGVGAVTVGGMSMVPGAGPAMGGMASMLPALGTVVAAKHIVRKTASIEQQIRPKRKQKEDRLKPIRRGMMGGI